MRRLGEIAAGEAPRLHLPSGEAAIDRDTAERLAKLSPERLREAVAGLTDEELVALADLVSREGVSADLRKELLAIQGERFDGEHFTPGFMRRLMARSDEEVLDWLLSQPPERQRAFKDAVRQQIREAEARGPTADDEALTTEDLRDP